MENETETKQYKTPSYMRKCYNDYYQKNKNNDQFKEKRREAQKKYYLANKEKVLARVKARQAQVKHDNQSASDPEEYFSNEH